MKLVKSVLVALSIVAVSAPAFAAACAPGTSHNPWGCLSAVAPGTSHNPWGCVSAVAPGTSHNPWGC